MSPARLGLRAACAATAINAASQSHLQWWPVCDRWGGDSRGIGGTQTPRQLGSIHPTLLRDDGLA